MDSDFDVRLKALADPTRRSILKRIWHTAVSAGEIATVFGVSRPAISRHLRVLREARLVVVTTRGTSRFYRADHATLADFQADFNALWNPASTNP